MQSPDGRAMNPIVSPETLGLNISAVGSNSVLVWGLPPEGVARVLGGSSNPK